jgi:hypothetical protein
MSATVIILLCALACPVSMGLMMVFMRRRHGASHSSRRSDEVRVRERDDE